MTEMINLDSPKIGSIEKKYMIRCLDSTFVSTHGPYVHEFESGFGKVIGSVNTVALQSGTAGLHMALHEAGIGPGDEVIVPALTFSATANAVKYVGAEPVFVDVDPVTWNMEPLLLKKAITAKTKGIIPVHLYGNPCSMDDILFLSNEHGLIIIEDATESLGSSYGGKSCGTIGDFGVFSFNGNKMITTGGGGMLTAKSGEHADHIKFLVNQARDDKRGYYYPEIGFNYRMTNLEASLGLAQLERLTDFIEIKKSTHRIYEEIFSDIPGIKLQKPCDNADSVWWLSSIVIEYPDNGLDIPRIQQLLKEKKIPTRRIFMPLVESPPYAEPEGRKKYPNSYYIYDNGLSLPSSTLNTESDISYVAETMVNIIKGKNTSYHTASMAGNKISDIDQENVNHDLCRI